MNVRIKTIGDLMQGHPSVEIVCLVKRGVVRQLKDKGDLVELDPNEPTKPDLFPKVMVRKDQPVIYDPWAFDRGSVLFHCPEVGTKDGLAKLCTELDILRFPNGDEVQITVDHSVGRATHEVRVGYQDGGGRVGRSSGEGNPIA